MIDRQTNRKGNAMKTAIRRAPAAVFALVASIAAGGATAAGLDPAIRTAPDETTAAVIPLRGVQIYECQAGKDKPDAYQWAFIAPQALIPDAAGKVVGNHYAGPTWEANDGSRIKGSVKGRQDGGPGNIPWLLLTTAAEGNGLFGGVTSVQRLNTRGGVAPESGCDARAVGRRIHVEYSADYHFFRRN